MFVARPTFSIFFCGQANSFAPQQFYGIENEAALRVQPQFKDIAKQLNFTSLNVLKQTHSASGIIIDAQNMCTFKPYQQEGDYLITNAVGAGIAIATADCVSLILYDIKNHVLAAIHAGWRGSIAEIALRALEALSQNFGSQVPDIEAVFGPSARNCCYEVGQDFINQVPADYKEVSLSARGGRWYFDTVAFNKHMLQRAGVLAQNISLEYAICTICSATHCSYRRDGQKANRQMTIAVLKPV